MLNWVMATRRPRIPGRRNLGDVHRRDDRRPAHAEPAEEAEEQKRVPVPGQGAADRGNEVEHRDRRTAPSAGRRDRPAGPPTIDPMIVPIRAVATVKPSQNEPGRPSQDSVNPKTLPARRSCRR